MRKGRVTISRLARLACILLGVLCAACKADELVVEYREVEHRFSVAERRAIERIMRWPRKIGQVVKVYSSG